MHSIAVAINFLIFLIIGVGAVGVFSCLPYVTAFKDLCRNLACFEGRSEEQQSIVTVGDGSFNKYENQIYDEVSRNEFGRFEACGLGTEARLVYATLHSRTKKTIWTIIPLICLFATLNWYAEKYS
jgi:hypothetical protein